MDQSIPGLARLVEENHTAFYLYLARDFSVRKTRQLVRYETGIPYPSFNGVLRTRLDFREADTTIEKHLAHFRRRDLPMVWWIGPSDYPLDLGERLQRKQLIPDWNAPGMYLPLDSFPCYPMVDGLRIEQVRDRNQLSLWMETLAAGFEYEGPGGDAIDQLMARAALGSRRSLRLYLGLLRGQPAAVCSLFVQGSVAGVYSVATVPLARRCGIGTAMVLECLKAAHSSGCQLAVLQSTTPDSQIYERIGFRECCRIRSFVLVY